jgi:hypothetical protein
MRSILKKSAQAVKNTRIDWPNHIVAFFSALFGILIAFQLDEWREDAGQHRLATEALKRIRSEANLNKDLLVSNITRNEKSIDELISVLPFVANDLFFAGWYQAADSINRNNPAVHILLDSARKNSAKLVRFEMRFGLDHIAVPEIHTSAWESAKATGALNFMTLEQVDLLSLIYSNGQLRDDLNDLRAALKRSDDVTTRQEFASILTELQKTNTIIKRELATYESYVTMLGYAEHE